MSRGNGRVSISRRALALAGSGAVLAAQFSTPDPAWAYVGPGAGLALSGSLIAVVLAGVIVLVGLVLFPLRVLMKKIRASNVHVATDETLPSGPDAP